MSTDKCVLNKRQIYSPLGLTSAALAATLYCIAINNNGGSVPVIFISLLIPLNQSPHLTKDRFVWIILNYVILSVLDVNNIF